MLVETVCLGLRSGGVLSGQGDWAVVGQENGGEGNGVFVQCGEIGFTGQGLQGFGGRLVKLIN